MFKLVFLEFLRYFFDFSYIFITDSHLHIYEMSLKYFFCSGKSSHYMKHSMRYFLKNNCRFQCFTIIKYFIKAQQVEDEQISYVPTLI